MRVLTTTFALLAGVTLSACGGTSSGVDMTPTVPTANGFNAI